MTTRTHLCTTPLCLVFYAFAIGLLNFNIVVAQEATLSASSGDEESVEIGVDASLAEAQEVAKASPPTQSNAEEQSSEIESPEAAGDAVPAAGEAGPEDPTDKPANGEPLNAPNTSGDLNSDSGETESKDKPTVPNAKSSKNERANRKKNGSTSEDVKDSKEAEPKRLPKLGISNGPMLPGQRWRVHDMRRPRPSVVTPGKLSTYDKPGTAPSDAIVLFDGTDLSNWCHLSKEDPSQLIEAQWKVEKGYFEVSKQTGPLQTIDSYGDCQLHLEWQTPAIVRGDSQGRGNSGIFFMEEFEVQILDSFNNRTYADGQAGALYGQYPPMVNASRKPGEWQVYDILFEAPVYSLEGELEKPASVTVMHNGLFIHHARNYYGPTGGGVVPKYPALSPAAPIALQNHGNPVRFRNIWVRPLRP